jgi:hypothetical protein
MMQKANVSHGSTKMVRSRELPCVRRSMSLYRGRVVRNAVLMSMERKKVMKKQRRRKKRNDGKSGSLLPEAEFEC